MKLPLSLSYIKETFIRALKNIKNKRDISMPLILKTQKKSKDEAPLKLKKTYKRNSTKAKGSIHSDATTFNHPRKDLHGTHG